MEIKKTNAKITLFFKEKIEPNSMLIASLALSISLLIAFISFLNSLERKDFNLTNYLLLFTFAFGLGSLSYTIIRLSGLLKQTKSFAKQAVDVAERAMNITEKMFEAIEKSRNPQVLIERFLSIKSIFMYYIDNPRVNDLYQRGMGRKQLQTVTEEWAGEQGSGLSIGLKDIIHGNLSEKTTSKFSGTSQVQEPGMDEKFLTVQSSLLRNDNVELGYELSLYQIENELNVVGKHDNGEALLIDDFAKWFSKEEERLNTLSGFILLEAEFLIQEFYLPQNNYKLTFTRPMVQNTVIDPRVEFRITLAKDVININEQLLINNHLEKRVKFRVFGHVSAKSEGKTARDKVIDILPLAIYQ